MKTNHQIRYTLDDNLQVTLAPTVVKPDLDGRKNNWFTLRKSFGLDKHRYTDYRQSHGGKTWHHKCCKGNASASNTSDAQQTNS